MTKKYKAGLGAPFGKAAAQKIGERIEVLMAKKGGEVVPSDVVEDARKKTSPMHRYFDWDDSVAAEKYRLSQARKILRSIVEVIVVRKKPQEHRSFYNVDKSKGKSCYVSLQRVVAEPDFLEQLVSEAQQGIEHLNKTLGLFIVHYKRTKQRK